MLTYSVHGKQAGDLIIFVNGAGVGPWMWAHQTQYYRAYKCITFDLPGHGTNRKSPFASIHLCAQSIQEIIEKESTGQKVILVGHSIGAQIILEMLKNPQSTISHAVIISGLNKPMTGAALFVKPMVSMTMPLAKYRWFAKVQAKTLSIPEEHFNSYYETSKNISKQSLLNILSDNLTFTFTKKEASGARVLLLVGGKEQKVMIYSTVRTAELLEESEAYLVETAGHDMPYTAPDITNQLIDRFIGNESGLNQLEIQGAKRLVLGDKK